MKWKQNYQIQYHDIDMSGTVTPSNVLKYMQETANRQMAAQGPSYDQLIAEGKSFVICRLRIDYRAPLHAYEAIEGQSWPYENKNASFYRQYAIVRDGETVAIADSIFALVDVSSGRLLRADEVTLNYSMDEHIPMERPLRFRIPSDLTLSEVGRHRVLYRDCDCNIHMNNTKYPDILCGFIPGIEKKTVLSVGINFQYAAPYGENITVLCAERDGTFYFRTLREDGKVNVEAEVLTEEKPDVPSI